MSSLLFEYALQVEREMRRLNPDPGADGRVDRSRPRGRNKAEKPRRWFRRSSRPD